MNALAGLVEKNLMAPDWADALAPVEPKIAEMGAFLRDELAKGRPYLPSGERVFNAFRRPLADVRVLIVGQDPYPTIGHPIGLSFAVEKDVRPIPASLRNIYAELGTDLDLKMPEHGDLTTWADRGVMLLNTSLTVRPGASGSHSKKGWQDVTGRAIEVLAERGGPLVAILWGRHAQSLKPKLGSVPSIESVHPSPLSARGGFFGSRPFSRTNALLVEQGAEPIDWSLPD